MSKVGVHTLISKVGVHTLISKVGVHTLICKVGVHTLISKVGVHTLICKVGVHTLISKCRSSHLNSQELIPFHVGPYWGIYLHMKFFKINTNIKTTFGTH